MKKIFAICAGVLLLAACNSGEQFCIEGEIANAEDSVLYLENIGIEQVTCVDSVKLDADGTFSFSSDAKDEPDFYRLRIANQIINVCVDSTEVITVKADYKKMATDYSIEGNDDCKDIKELTLKQMALRTKILSITGNENIGASVENDSILKVINEYKEDVRSNYVYKQSFKASSYFALFQTIGGMLIFNPSTDADDVKAFAAVATSWDTYYPNSLRGENLHNITIEGMNNTRYMKTKGTINIDPSKIQTAGVIDISLPDNNGKLRTLTELKGKVVLLHFNVFNTNSSPAIVMKLRDLYNKYHSAGLEIYQVSLDDSEHYWKTSTAALPWVNVRDADGEASHYMAAYNVQSAGEAFLIDRTNTLDSRHTLDDIEARIKALL